MINENLSHNNEIYEIYGNMITTMRMKTSIVPWSLDTPSATASTTLEGEVEKTRHVAPDLRGCTACRRNAAFQSDIELILSCASPARGTSV